MDKENKEMMKQLNNKILENVTGGSRGPDGWICDMCGNLTDSFDIETYEIRIDYTNPEGSEYLGMKDVCLRCRDTHLEEYIAKNGWGDLEGIYMKGPLY